ncbi:hypothetical protein F2P56_007601 [Juglans regia]|uniref:White-brown complex homolog protein 30 n=2 Tax=Juglans regia TaxID=51240 RepID=A0A2I4EMD2_JUGRE|nr:putative white-brown complex homolog protein 30 [Juglans regia]KAF5475836.1 hypothetical protein F2P56_007601 [Juglans regia]
MALRESRIHVCWIPHVLTLYIIVGLSLLPCIQCVDGNDYSQTGNPAVLPIVTQLIYGRLSNLTKILSQDIKENLGFCIKDVDVDWHGAFNFAGKLDFLTNCIKKTKGDLTQRLCTAAELRFYFKSLFERGAAEDNYLKPNKNCNLSSWVSGCEPGWGCSVDQDQNHVDLKNSKAMPSRTHDCQPCCEGFFCPQGITCMIPCPLGSYCPLAKLNKTTGICDPYSYQIPPGTSNHTCGGADIWADVERSNEIFCSPGSYCPTTIREVPCRSGHYCRMGSTSEKLCFKLTTCNPNTANQNIHAYGVMLLVALCTLLLFIYNCSDQVLSTRERRQAKSREAAARHARETAQARERWKSAKDIAKKSAGGLQEHLSRTFSRKKSVRQPEQMMVLGQAKPGKDDARLPPLPLGSSSTSVQSSGTSKGKKKEPSNLTKMLHSLEENPDSNEGFHLEIGDKNIKKNMPKGKQLSTHSQIFKYAYGQLEKEKAMQQENKNLTFSGVISMAAGGEIRTRPMIEVAFKDLTLTLKGKKKHLLRCVTGKFMPGRVSAVMGPSGAGKTTFLSALAGKVTGCNMSGLILINGKVESMQSYKKIIGFVPQDDIVHGNLTVEENLRFSARCRLSADMPKPDKVLVIERVIECLGLQAVRDSLVGTVEKRGISGGQRKRVNVGLEMVMEPSLLILDEPTTGLDSSSSLLLLRALRREALEGVNICMVVHQPSYALFKMFDDLILLAKGGLTAYHGSAKKVEEYFAGLGINVPERVNPPDHFIDILEGIVKPSSGVTREQLPVRWMLKNGYRVPADMLQYADGLAAMSSTKDLNPGDDEASTTEQQSFAGDLWEDMKFNVETKRDRIQHNFLKSKDLSNRRTPGVARQYRYFLGRVSKQRLREARVQAIDYMILLLAGACLGTLAKVSDATFGSLGYTYTVIAVSLLCKISALRTFSLDKLQYWRESASGISSLAHFLSKDAVELFNTFIKPLLYLSMFYFFNNPRSSFTDNYVILVCLVYCVTGIAYILSIYLEPSPAQLWSAILPVVLTLIAVQENDNRFLKYLGKLCYTKWALEAFVISNAKRYSGVWLITRCSYLMQSGYDLHDWAFCLLFLILAGIACRVLAFFCMVTFTKR